MAAPEYSNEGDYWNTSDEAEGYAAGAFDENEPRVSIPEILEEHRTAFVVTAVGSIGLIAAAVATKHFVGRKDKE